MFCYSTDEERFYGREANRETAAHIAFTETDADKVWTAEIVEVTASTYLLGDVVDDMREAAWDEMGDYSEGWLDNVTAEQRRELDDGIAAVIDAWATKHNLQPHFFDIQNIQEHSRG